MIHVAFESTNLSVEKSRETVNVSFYSNESKHELEVFIDRNYKPGNVSVRGAVETVKYRQNGPIWYADVSCYTNYAAGILVGWGLSRPQNHSLRSLRVSLPLEKAPGYRTKWNHYLWLRVPLNYEDGIDSEGTPEEYDTATTDVPFQTSGFWWKWSKTADEVDPTPNGDYFWKCMAGPTKPGVESFDYSTYQITEYGEYPNEKQAAWITNVMLNRIRTEPLLGDFGLGEKLASGFNWKCEDASIDYNGKKWQAQMVWTLSGDANGWDSDLYEAAASTTTTTPGYNLQT